MEDKTRTTTTDPVDVLENALTSVAQLPGVRIDRTMFLTKVLSPHCSTETVEQAIAQGPIAAGLDALLVRRLADESINLETARVTALSTVAGMPGGFAFVATVPADLAQNLAHILRVAQKLAYLYGWPDLFSGDDNSMDESTKRVLVLFIGVMFGVGGAAEAVTKLSALMAMQAVRQLPRRVLKNAWVYLIVKKVAIHLVGKYLKKGIFAKSVTKVVPVVGGLVSGGLTLAGFRPMCARLRDHFEKDAFTAPDESPDVDSVDEPTQTEE